MGEFRERAKALKARAADVQKAPLLQRATLAGELVEDVAAFLVDLSARVDALTPYQDEGAGNAR